MPKANLLSRFIALAIDTVVVYLVGLVIGFVIGDQVLGVGVGFLTGLLYNTYFWTQNNGQTPGKSFLGIRVVSTNGGSINVLQAVIRYGMYYVNTFALFLGWLWALVDGNNQGWHDKLAGTYVVKA